MYDVFSYCVLCVVRGMLLVLCCAFLFHVVLCVLCVVCCGAHAVLYALCVMRCMLFFVSCML